MIHNLKFMNHFSKLLSKFVTFNFLYFLLLGFRLSDVTSSRKASSTRCELFGSYRRFRLCSWSCLLIAKLKLLLFCWWLCTFSVNEWFSWLSRLRTFGVFWRLKGENRLVELAPLGLAFLSLLAESLRSLIIWRCLVANREEWDALLQPGMSIMQWCLLIKWRVVIWEL